MKEQKKIKPVYKKEKKNKKPVEEIPMGYLNEEGDYVEEYKDGTVNIVELSNIYPD